MNVNLIHLFFVKNTYRKGLFIMSKKLVAFSVQAERQKSSRDDCRGSKSGFV